MVARLLFPAFAARHSTGYHAHLAEVVPFLEKVQDPAFRMKSTVRHIEDFSNLYSANASKQAVQSFTMGLAMAKAVETGMQTFWQSWFSGLADMSTQASKAFESPRTSSFLVSDRSEDDHVLSVNFRNRYLTSRALGEIRKAQ